MKKVGLLGGTFDPVHIGHLHLALCLSELCQLDMVLFVPTGISPFKESAPPIASAEHRLAMLKLALEPIKSFQILDWELENKSPNYTIDTVRRLTEEESFELHLLIGDDHSAHFSRWREAEELARLAPPFIGYRGEEHPPSRFGKYVKMPLLEISSTDIRERLLQKKYCGHLLPALVLDYIQQHHLYSRA